MVKKNLKDRVKEFSIQLPIMEGREKGEFNALHGSPVTIADYGFMKDSDEKQYVCFTVKEDDKRFYFGGQVLTDQMQQLDNEGYHDEAVKNGLPVMFGEKKGKNNRVYTTVEFYPETAKEAKK